MRSLEKTKVSLPQGLKHIKTVLLFTCDSMAGKDLRIFRDLKIKSRKQNETSAFRLHIDVKSFIACLLAWMMKAISGISGVVAIWLPKRAALDLASPASATKTWHLAWFRFKFVSCLHMKNYMSYPFYTFLKNIVYIHLLYIFCTLFMRLYPCFIMFLSFQACMSVSSVDSSTQVFSRHEDFREDPVADLATYACSKSARHIAGFSHETFKSWNFNLKSVWQNERTQSHSQTIFQLEEFFDLLEILDMCTGMS